MHSPDGRGDVVFFTMALLPGAAAHGLASRWVASAASRCSACSSGPTGDDPHTTDVGGARVEIVRPFEEIRLCADPDRAAIGLDLTFRARTQPYGAAPRHDAGRRRGRVGPEPHPPVRAATTARTPSGGVDHEVDGWIGQRDHSWGVRDHGRCPLWMWFQIQLDDGFLGVWHWEYENGARVYTDGCWAGTDRSEPVPVVDFRHDVDWIGADGAPAAYGEHGEAVTGLRGSCTFTLAGGRRITVEADGTFDRPYEPFHRGGLNQMRVRADDGREGTAIYEVTGARHHHFFPDAVVTGELPT